MSEMKSEEHKEKVMKKKAAFTLAEVLITLAIIGIVAALTIPTLMNKYDMLTTATKLRKFYSTMVQVNERAVSEEGNWQTWELTGAKPVFNKYFRKYLSVVKINDDSDWVYFVLKDGTCGRLRTNGGTSVFKDYYIGISTNCASVDDYGRDFFEISLWNLKDTTKLCNDSATGCGWPGNPSYYNPSYANRKDKASCSLYGGAWNSYACFMKFLQDGMKFSEDYKFSEHKSSKPSAPSMWDK